MKKILLALMCCLVVPYVFTMNSTKTSATKTFVGSQQTTNKPLASNVRPEVSTGYSYFGIEDIENPQEEASFKKPEISGGYSYFGIEDIEDAQG